MAKSRERLLARELRRKGESIREIAKNVGVTKSSVSLWCRDIVLTDDQRQRLIQNDVSGGMSGRLKSRDLRIEERLSRVDYCERIGKERVDQISNRELFLLGLALYWAEGSKTERRIIMVNSDPAMIILFIGWVYECFKIPSVDLSCRVQINESHKYRMKVVETYWSKVSGIPLTQFTKTSLIHSVSKKKYDEPNSYYGVLAIKVRRGTNMSYLLDGGIKHLRRIGNLML